MNLAYLGPKFTYSEFISREFAEERGTMRRSVASLEAVARSVASGESDIGVMAYYNFLDGLVQSCLDLIYENGLNIIDAKRLPIQLSIGRLPKTDIDAVYSHPKALAQSSEWLFENIPQIAQVPVASTAAGGQEVLRAKRGAVIAHEDALEYAGMEIIAYNIGNKKHGRKNFTDFYLVGEDGSSLEDGGDYLTMIAVTPHVDRVGLLEGILKDVACEDLNIAKIHSRPAIDDVAIDNEPQMFYLEIMGHKDNSTFKRCVDSLQFNLTPKGSTVDVVRVLGSYKRPNGV